MFYLFCGAFPMSKKNKLSLIISIVLLVALGVVLPVVLFLIYQCDGITKTYKINGVKLLMDRKEYSDDAIILTSNDIFLKTMGTGLGFYEPRKIFIENQEQLEIAYERYEIGMGFEYYATSQFAEEFNEMVNQYPIDDYNYVIDYTSYGSGCKYVLGALVIDDKNSKMSFELSSDSKFPSSGYAKTQEIYETCNVAAVPKVFMKGQYDGWKNPELSDLYQLDEKYGSVIRFNASDTTELYETYGDIGYVIQNEDEFNLFVEKTENASIQCDKSVFDELKDVDYKKCALLIKFIKSDYSEYSYDFGEVWVDENSITMDFDVTPGNYTGYIVARIPRRRVPINLPEGWVSPSE